VPELDISNEASLGHGDSSYSNHDPGAILRGQISTKTYIGK